MKIIRRISLFLAIIFSVLCIEVVHADMSAPKLREFEIVVINPNGVDYYDNFGNASAIGHLNKGDIVVVLYEYSGTYTIGQKEINQYGSEVNKTLGTIKSLNGFSIVQEEVDPTKLSDDESITKYDTPRKARIYASEGVDIYKGPSNVYEKVGHIKKDVVLTYNYSIDSYSSTTHIYVNYNGVKGWVEILGSKVLIQNDTQYIFSTDVTTECGTIPRNSVTTPNYKTDGWYHNALFEYNGCEFIHNTFRDEEIYDIYVHNEVTAKEVTLYEYADTSSNVVATIPKGTEVTVLASKDSIGDSDYIIYIKYNDTKGWALGTGNIFDYNKKPKINEDKPEIKVEDSLEEPKVTTEEPITKTPELTTFIILCASGAGLLIITALVIIILINKSKKNKKEEEPIEK